MVTDEQIDEAVPPNGIPNRARTNAILKAMRDDAAQTGRQIAEATPTDGQTLAFLENSRDMILVLNGEQGINSLELVLPPDNISKDGQICRVISYIGIDELTVSGAANIMGAPPQVFEGDTFALVRVEEGKWASYK